MKKNNNILYIIVIITIIIIALIAINILTNSKEGKLISLDYNEIKEKVKNKEDFILIVSQSTCSHCVEYKPILERIANKNKINIYYIDYDKSDNKEEFLEEFDLDGSTPITLFFNEGKEKSILNRINGTVSEKKALEKFKKMGFIK